ncbi:ABC-2 type transport system permease protein [Salirhabdus euzebyi]|uniref:ABC-2 type transport system permease protein n=1 Tax=Salirhabdus euzebyi TaxID=394506 RepID=A0A841Q4A1_9BACI|nr:ABC transporter permease [Salirhabdus euzebyi]MBB6453217.1 ABC-2 type transport system permease protein [Salirhabdus euzebyi]
MLNLIKNEWIKLFKRTGTFVMIGLIILLLTFVGIIIRSQENPDRGTGSENWEEQLQTEINNREQELKDIQNAPQSMIDSYQRDIAINKYRIEHNLSPHQDYSVWGFVYDASNIIQFAGLFVIIVAAGIVASEFNWGTIKLLLIRPISRGKILVAKYITVILFALLMLIISFAYSSLVGVILFGTPETTAPHLNYYNGTITEQNMGVHLIILYSLKSINMLMLATMAFMISAVFRNSSLAIGLSIFLMFAGGQLTAMLAQKFEWAKYILFANTELMQYIEGVPLIEGMTLAFSVMVLVVYFIIFQFLAHYVFHKRDVAA